MTVLSLEVDAGEERFRHEAVDAETPEVLFDRRWALDLLDRVLRRLRQDWEDQGRVREFELLKDSLLGEHVPGGYEALAAQLQTTEGAVKVAVYRMRRKYQQYLRQSIAETVSSDEAIADELRHLFQVLRR